MLTVDSVTKRSSDFVCTIWAESVTWLTQCLQASDTWLARVSQTAISSPILATAPPCLASSVDSRTLSRWAKR